MLDKGRRTLIDVQRQMTADRVCVDAYREPSSLAIDRLDHRDHGRDLVDADRTPETTGNRIEDGLRRKTEIAANLHRSRRADRNQVVAHDHAASIRRCAHLDIGEVAKGKEMDHALPNLSKGERLGGASFDQLQNRTVLDGHAVAHHANLGHRLPDEVREWCGSARGWHADQHRGQQPYGPSVQKACLTRKSSA